MREEFYVGETFEFDHAGATFVATIEADDDHGAPWEDEDGHGSVSEWTSRSKLPGEMVLSEDRGRCRYYDFAETCRIARRETWGWLPDDLITRQDPDGRWVAEAGKYRAVSVDINTAIRGVHAQHRATLSPRAYAAGAALKDFEYLRRWCADEWRYVGVVVRRADDCECCGETESLWGIESCWGDYIRETATELADELIHRAQEAA